jgi:hypothetical protein
MNTRNSITSQDEKLVNMQMSIGYKSGLQKQLKMVYMTITNNCCPIQRVIRGLSRMKGNFHVRFLEEGEGAISPSYSAIFTDLRASVSSVQSASSAQSVFHRHSSAYVSVHLRFIFRKMNEALAVTQYGN